MGNDTDSFVHRYVHLWNEGRAAARRALIEELWASDGANATPSLQAVGYDEIESRVASSFEHFVGTGLYRFRAAGPAVSHHGAVLVPWEMVAVDGGAVASVGLEFLMLDSAGKIVSDHQFVLV
jgi:hypothetical protein